MTSIARAVRRPSVRPLTIALALVFLASAAPFGPSRPATTAAATPVTAGFSDFQYGDPAAPGGDDVTASRVQSKLWINDGRWFGVMFDPRSTPNAKFRIFRFDMPTQNWTNTAIPVDDRNRSHADVLPVGDTLYVASARAETSVVGTVGRDLRIYKYTYNAVSKTYALVGGFPKLIPSTPMGTSYSTIAQDATGRLWVAFTQVNRVRVSSSSDAGATWSAPIDVPGQGNNVTSNDIAAVASMNGGVGVLWSNQAGTDDAFYFAAHVNGQPVGTWQARENAYGDPANLYDADGHISLKTDASGNLIAAIKTGHDANPGPNAGELEIGVIKRTGAASAAGTWDSHIVTGVGASEGTRPVLVLDSAASEANVFLTYPTLAGDGQQSIYRRTAPLSTLNFGSAGVGSLFISSATDLAINDATSTKQITTSGTGIIVEATNIPNLRYLHGCAGAPCPVAPVADFTGTPTSGNAPLTVNFTDTSTNTPTNWLWNFGDSGTSTAQNPSHVYANPGTYTVSLTATNPAGSGVVTKSNYITVGAAPANRFFPINPVRIFNTRDAAVTPGGPMQSNVPRTIEVKTKLVAAGAISPSTVITAVTGNLTVANATAAGYVSLTTVATASPGTSILNFPAGDARANGVTVKVDGAGKVFAVYKVGGGSGILGKTTNLFFDATGYFTETSSGGNTFHPLPSPKRVLNTRDAAVTPGGRLFSSVPKEIDVKGKLVAAGIVPGTTTITAVTGNLTVADQTAAGYVSLGPVSTSTPTTSTLNFPVGDPRANGVTVKLNAAGKLYAVYKVGNLLGKRTNLFFDVTGYFTADSTGVTFVPMNPVRTVDTRINLGVTGRFADSTPKTWAGRGNGVGNTATAIVGNVTVVGQTRAGYVSVTPDPVAIPTVSTINFPVGDVRANGFTVALSSTGTVSATYKGPGGTTNLVVDVMGYYQP